jgi:hypothetical protein
MDESATTGGATPRHAPDQVDARRVSWAALALVVTLAACVLASVWLAGRYARDYARPRATPPDALPISAGVPMQPDPGGDLARFRAQKEALLEGYRWLDRDKGVVQIPIEDAMRIVAQRHGAAGTAR